MKAIRSFLAVLLAGIIAISGSGANIVHYCCHSCEEKGIVEIAMHGCDEVHHQGAEHSCCATCEALPTIDQPVLDHNHEDCCLVEHLAFDLDQVVHAMLSVCAVAEYRMTTGYTSRPKNRDTHSVQTTCLCLHSGRDVLSLYSVLLI